MRVMVLHFEDGQAERFCKASCFIARVQIGGDGGGRDGEKPFHAWQGLAQGLKGAQIAHVTEIGRGVEERVLG